ncbi:hypothetical protein WA026_016875 [Henosepilachna vigintioctopunctata]|uniref:Uncharacterized protein n=1 Tax=Henosepilachna vigintioctopunctata TaxID=420089 RepID=A0AAW1U8V5_9CUCU
MPQCAIVTCNNSHRRTKGGNVRYHRFPGDHNTRSRWLQVCGKTIPNCSTARVCSRHFSKCCYERDVQHELLGLPSRCRLKKGAVPDSNLPPELPKEEVPQGSAIDILLAVGLVPSLTAQKSSGGLPRDLQKMRIMEDVREGCMVQPSSPGHAELRPDNETAEETCQKSEDSQNEDASEYCDQIEVDSVKQEVDVKSPNADQSNNADCEPKNSQKRKHDDEETFAKRLRSDIEENFRQRDKILNDFMDIIDTDNSTAEQLRVHSEQLLSEIKAMNELARDKEMEWNNIIHLKKIKEELLIRIERKRQISIMNGDKPDSDGDNDENRAKQSSHNFQRYMLSRSPKIDLANRNRHILPKPAHYELNGSFDPRQGVRNRPTLDVQSIIADYRQRHPEAVPRRGRRIRNSHNGANGNSGILNFSSMALGSGSQVKHNLQDMGNELNMLLNVMDANRGDTSRPSSADSSHDAASFKDILVQLAKLSQNERNELLQNAMKPPPPYPEVTVHPVTTVTSSPTNSLLHGILTKSPLKPNNKTAFSPTLARLLTAPERAGNHLTSSPLITSSHNHPSNMSISEILSTSKARNEITITPVDSQFDQPMKGSKAMTNAEDDETEDSADRLVIDESNEDGRRTLDNTSDGEDEVPPCQGCNQKIAQFVCAGCGRQWYCSRDCQVAAWDEHSEVCTG